MASKNFKKREVELLRNVTTILEQERLRNRLKIEERERTGEDPDQELVDKDKFLTDELFNKETQIIQGQAELNNENLQKDNLSIYPENTNGKQKDEDLELC